MSPRGDDHSDTEEGRAPLEVKTLLEEILKLLLPGETVAKGIKRLGGGAKRGRVARVRQGRRREEAKHKDTSESRDGNVASPAGGEKDGTDLGGTHHNHVQPDEAEPLEQLISFADQMVALGNYEVYQDTYEKLAYRLRGLTASPALDMFADEVDEEKLEEKKGNIQHAASVRGMQGVSGV